MAISEVATTHTAGVGRLAVRVTPERGEGALGFALRASLACGYDHPFWLSCETDRRPGDWPRLYRASDAHSVLQSVGLPPERASEFGAAGTSRDKFYSLGEGLSVHATLLDRKHPKICPECLEVEPYLRGHWELRLWAACPVHGCVMETRCPDCGGEHGWERKRLDGGCDLGRPRTSLRERRVSEVALDLLRCIARVAGYEAPRPSDKLLGLIGHLSLRELSMLIHRLSGVVQASGREDVTLVSSWTPSATEASAAVHAAATFLAEWPESLHNALDAHLLTAPDRGESERPGPSYYQKSFLHLFTGPPFAFVRVIAQDWLSRKYAASPRPKRVFPSRCGFMVAAEGRLGPAGAGELLNRSGHIVRRYVREKLLAGTIERVDGRDLFSMARADVEAAVRRERLDMDLEAACRDAGALSLSDVAKTLGVGWKIVREFRDSGLLGACDVRVHFMSFYRRSVLDQLLSDLAGEWLHGPSLSAAYLENEDNPATFFTFSDAKTTGSCTELVRAALKGSVKPSVILDSENGLRRFGYSRTAWNAVLAQLNPASLAQNQVADFLGCSPLTVRTLLKAGVLSSVDPGEAVSFGSGPPQRISKLSVVDLASRMISTSGLSRAAGLHPNGLKAYLQLTALQPEIQLGSAETTLWLRSAVVEALTKQGLSLDFGG